MESLVIERILFRLLRMLIMTNLYNAHYQTLWIASSLAMTCYMYRHCEERSNPDTSDSIWIALQARNDDDLFRHHSFLQGFITCSGLPVAICQVQAESLIINSVGHRPMVRIAPPLSGCKPDIT